MYEGRKEGNQLNQSSTFVFTLYGTFEGIEGEFQTFKQQAVRCAHIPNYYFLSFQIQRLSPTGSFYYCNEKTKTMKQKKKNK